jgi:hypothetical protein
MKTSPLLLASFIAASICSVGFSDDLADIEQRVQKAISAYEGCFLGHRYTLVREQDIRKIEFNSSKPLIARTVVEHSSKDGRKVRFASYFSEPLLQNLLAREQTDPKRPETDSTGFGVTFLEESSLTRNIMELVPYVHFSPAKSLLEIYEESKRSVVPNRSGIRFEHPSGTITFCEINSKDLLTRVTQQIGPGVTLNDGSKGPRGINSETTLRFQWSDETVPAVTEILTEVKVNGSVKGKGRVMVEDRAQLEAPLGSLISLDSFDLKNGDNVTCEALQGRFFQFMDGRVVAVADTQALSAARNSRWRNNFVGSAFYHGIFALLLLGISGFILWKRR